MTDSKIPMTTYNVGAETIKRLGNIFNYHKPNFSQTERYTQIRSDGIALALRICACTPPSREQEIALTKLEEAVMFANAAIARNEDSPQKA